MKFVTGFRYFAKAREILTSACMYVYKISNHNNYMNKYHYTVHTLSRCNNWKECYVLLDFAIRIFF